MESRDAFPVLEGFLSFVDNVSFSKAASLSLLNYKFVITPVLASRVPVPIARPRFVFDFVPSKVSLETTLSARKLSDLISLCRS